ncbi:MAG: hypothetical protein MRERV_93c007 [Mycoplasmataceae bacterium RV_VA103A]|nr:MAG: hypothetical protein MRERV_93c007 [Mycoplasmataceae bacterium RV_VA103A]
MKEKYLTCKKEIKEGFMFCESCWTVNPQTENQERGQAEVPSYFPNSDYSDTNKKSYEMREINPSGKNADKYKWFICTPDFPAEQHKVNDPHCHAWPNDRRGEARISLSPTTLEPIKLKIKWGKVRGTDQTEIWKLVKSNKELIYQEWKDEWIR